MNTESQTDQLKQRIAEWKAFTHPFADPLILKNLLTDCLQHIEELEQKLAKALDERKQFQNALYGHVEFPSIGEAWERNAKLQSQLRERDADCAVMRNCLEQSDNVFRKVLLGDWLKLRDKALSSTAGRELLERLRRYETALKTIGQNSAENSWQFKIANEALQKDAQPPKR